MSNELNDAYHYPTRYWIGSNIIFSKEFEFGLDPTCLQDYCYVSVFVDLVSLLLCHQLICVL